MTLLTTNNAFSLVPLLFIGLGVFEVIVATFLILLPTIVWIWALVDILKSNFKDSTTKLLWLLVVIFLPLLGLILYVVLGRNQRI